MPNTNAYKIGKIPTGVAPKYNLHDFEFITSTKRACFVDILESQPSWNGGHVTRDIRNAIRKKFGFNLETVNVSSMIRDLERINPERIDISRGGGNGQYNTITLVAPAPPPPLAIRCVPPAPLIAVSKDTSAPMQSPLFIEARAETALLNAMTKDLQKLTITNRAITVQLDFQRQQLDFQAQELSRTQEEAGKLSSKLDYIASKVNSIAKAVKA